MVKIRFKNPLKTEAGDKAAWFLFLNLDRPFKDDFESFKKVLFQSIIRKRGLYKRISVPKKSSGQRILLIPRDDLKYLQKIINRKILKQERRHLSAFGFSGGNVRQALGPIVKANQPIFASDVVDAFPSTQGPTIFNVFRGIGYGFYASYFLTCLTTWPYKDTWQRGEKDNVGLPQGAPTSPRLFDLSFEFFDRKLARLAERVGGQYTRYADNIFFTARTFWPKRQIKHYVEGTTDYIDKWGTPCSKNYKIEMETIPEGVENYLNEDGLIVWFAPLISAIYETLNKGYRQRPRTNYSWTKDYWHYCAYQTYQLHKSYLAGQGQILHALGLNLIEGQLHNTRKFKRNLRLIIFNLQKAFEQKESFEEIVWPLYLKTEGMMQWAIQETLPAKLIAQWEQLDLEITNIRYSGSSGTWQKIENY